MKNREPSTCRNFFSKRLGISTRRWEKPPSAVGLGWRFYKVQEVALLFLPMLVPGDGKGHDPNWGSQSCSQSEAGLVFAFARYLDMDPDHATDNRLWCEANALRPLPRPGPRDGCADISEATISTCLPEVGVESRAGPEYDSVKEVPKYLSIQVAERMRRHERVEVECQTEHI